MSNICKKKRICMSISSYSDPIILSIERTSNAKPSPDLANLVAGIVKSGLEV